MELELLSKGLDTGKAKDLVTHLSAHYWVDDVDDAVETILNNAAVLDIL